MLCKPNDYSHASLEAVECATKKVDGQTVGSFKGYQLKSLFQPIFSISHGRIVGFESLLEAMDSDGNKVPPPAIADGCENLAELVFYDRLCRTIHLINFPWEKHSDVWLFLNINPKVIIHGIEYGDFFTDLLTKYEINSDQLVIEIIESDIKDESQLAEAVRYFHNINCLIALDDFGAGHSNFERIWRLNPDIIKLDKIFINQAMTDNKMRRILPNMVNLIHEANIIVLAEGIESEAQALISMESDVDLVQGYFYGKPEHDTVSNTEPGFFGLYDKFNHFLQETYIDQSSPLTTYTATYKEALGIMRKTGDLQAASKRLFHHQEIEYCYSIDAKGEQRQENLLAAHQKNPDPRLKPLQKPSDANWIRRPYFRKAIRTPHEIQVTRPYHSVADSMLCVTIACAYHWHGELIVFCCDINWDAINVDNFNALIETKP